MQTKAPVKTTDILILTSAIKVDDLVGTYLLLLLIAFSTYTVLK